MPACIVITSHVFLVFLVYPHWMVLGYLIFSSGEMVLILAEALPLKNYTIIIIIMLFNWAHNILDLKD